MSLLYFQHYEVCIVSCEQVFVSSVAEVLSKGGKVCITPFSLKTKLLI